MKLTKILDLIGYAVAIRVSKRRNPFAVLGLAQSHVYVTVVANYQVARSPQFFGNFHRLEPIGQIDAPVIGGEFQLVDIHL
jgi:hypothetical protein